MGPPREVHDVVLQCRTKQTSYHFCKGRPELLKQGGYGSYSWRRGYAQATQTHVTRKECKVTYLPWVTRDLSAGRAGVALQATYLRCILLCLGVCLLFYSFSWLYCITTVTTLNEVRAGYFDQAGSWTSRKKIPSFRRNSSLLQIFSASTQKENLLFLFKRSSRKKLYNFPIKLNHLCRTSKHVWLSSCVCQEVCDRRFAHQLICIMTISWPLTRRVQGLTSEIFELKQNSPFFFFRYLEPWFLRHFADSCKFYWVVHKNLGLNRKFPR